MNPVVIFDYVVWSLRYPNLASSVNSAQALMYFNEATLYCDNTPNSVIDNSTGQRQLMLDMLTAHIALLNANINGQPPSPIVGRINSATEGSVSVQSEMNYPPGSAQWFMQTQPGASYWAATAKYRTMRYVAGPRGFINPFNRNGFVVR